MADIHDTPLTIPPELFNQPLVGRTGRPDGPQWFDSHDELVAFVRWLEERGDISSADEAIDVFEEPWSYSIERAAMVAEEEPA